MKRKNIFIILFACMMFAAACVASGCYKDKFASVAGVWELNLDASDEIAKLAFKSAEIVIDPENRRGSIEAEFTDDVDKEKTDFPIMERETGGCEIDCSVSPGSHSVFVEFIVRNGDERWSLMSASIYDKSNTFEKWGYVYFNKDVGEFKAGEKCGFNLVFIKSGTSISPIPDPNPPKPNPPSGESKHEGIKTAYENAGYSVDITADDADPSVAALIKSMQDTYSQLGVKMTCIGKNLNDISFDTELYMLFSADSESAIQELADGFEGNYKYAKKGKDIIVYIWTLGTPNFTPFNQTT